MQFESRKIVTHCCNIISQETVSWSNLVRGGRRIHHHRRLFLPHLKTVTQNYPLQSKVYSFGDNNHYGIGHNRRSIINGQDCGATPRLSQSRAQQMGCWLGTSVRRHHATSVNPSGSTKQKSRKALIYLTGLVIAMAGSSSAAVPLYRRFCQATGYGGTVQRRESVEEKIARHAKDGTVTAREIVVQVNADVADGMPWKFIPTQREVRVKPGESALAFYTAENRSSAPITGVSTCNVTPMKLQGPLGKNDRFENGVVFLGANKATRQGSLATPCCISFAC